MHDGIFLSTDQVEPSLRNEFWRALFRPIFDVAPINEGDELQGSVTVRPIGQLTIGSAHCNRQLYRRNRQLIVDGGLDHYLLQLLIAGSMNADCDGISFSVRPGDICLFDLTRPYTSGTEGGARITLIIPRERIDAAAGGRSIHGLLLRSTSPLTRLLKNLILNLHRDAGKIGIEDTPAAELAMIDFAAAIVAHKVLKRSPAEHASERTLRAHILAFIDAHIADTELGTAMLMRQFQISRAHLYRVFAADGGVATMIRERRLDIAYRRLKTDADRSFSITTLAYELGFAGSGQFSRAFRARFGATPRDIRSGLSHHVENGPTSLLSHFASQAKQWSV